MIEVKLDESDRLDWALKTFKKKVLKSGILKDLRRKRHYVKPSGGATAQGRRGSASRAVLGTSSLGSVAARINSGGGRMSKEEALALDGIVSDVLPSAMFRVSLDNGHSVIATLAGQDASIPYSRPERRPRDGRGLAVRPHPRTHHVPS
jgi:ribosomal protein S21